MTKKLWFQVGIGLLIALLIIKYVIEIHWIFNPIVIIIKTIFIPVLLSGVLFYISEPFQRWLEKKGLPRWASISTIVLVLAGLVTGLLLIVGNPIAEQVNRLVQNSPNIGDKIMEATDFILENKDNLPPQVENFVDSVTSSIQDIVVVGSKSIVNFVSGTVSTIFTLILVPFFYIFMLKDHEKFAPNIYKIFTGERRIWVKNTLEDINEAHKYL